MSDFILSDSVGQGGVNRPDDVASLKSHLVALGFDWLSADDSVDAGLIRTINLVQSIKAGRNRIRGDGRVDVPGPTYEWLRAENAPKWQLMPAGDASEGFVNFERTDARDTHDYGTNWMADAIRRAGIWYRDNYLADHPGSTLLTINDVSLPQGGDTPDHSGHETGLACDLRLPRTDGTAPGNTTHRTASYDRSATRAMLRAIRVQPQVSRILFNDPDLVREGLCERAGGHDDHVHFEVEPLLPIVGYTEITDDLFQRAIRYFGGTAVTPDSHPMTLAGFQDFLNDSGVSHFSAREMLTPHHQDTASDLGYEIFLPPHSWWNRGAALALLADQLRALVGEPVVMRNWWRPRRYNAEVGGAEDSDHVTAHGVDLDYRSADSRRVAERRLRGLYESGRWLELSLGLGNLTTHVGLFSPGHHRDWLYDSYVE